MAVEVVKAPPSMVSCEVRRFDKGAFEVGKECTLNLHNIPLD
jgi:hypothetical protein